MNSRRIIAFLCVALSFFWMSLGFAEENKTKIEFTCAGWERIPDEILFVKEKKKDQPIFQKVDLAEMVRSLPYQIESDGTIPFFRKIPVAGAAEPSYKQVGLAKLQPGKKRFTILFFPNPDGTFLIRAIPDDRSDSPFGSYQFYNLSQIPISGVLGGQEFKLAPGSSHTIRLNVADKTALPYATYTDHAGKRTWLQRNTMFFNSEKHLKYFLYAEEDQNKRMHVKAKGLVEFRQPEKNDTEAIGNAGVQTGNTPG